MDATDIGRNVNEENQAATPRHPKINVNVTARETTRHFPEMMQHEVHTTPATKRILSTKLDNNLIKL